MDDIKKISNEIQKKKLIISGEKQLSEISDPHVKRTRLGNINRAKEDLKELYLKYRKAFQNRTVFILVTGTQCEKFAKLASTEEFSCFVEDPDTFYQEMVKDVPSILYTNRISSPGLFDHFNAQFEARASAIDIISFNAMIFESKYKKQLKNKQEAVELFKRVFNDKVGTEAVGLDIIDKVASKAVNQEYSGTIAPIVVFSEDQELIKDFSQNLRKISSNVFVISTGTKVDKKLKENSLCYIKSVTNESLEKSLLKVKENLI